MLAAHPNLNADISWVVYSDYIATDEASLSAWAQLVEGFPGRFLIGYQPEMT